MNKKLDREPILYTDAHICGYPNADSILCDDGIIQGIGPERTMRGRVRKRSLNHRYVYPGFNDTHLHVLGLGEYLSFVQLYGIRSVDDTLGVIRKALESVRPPQTAGWLRGMGWDQNIWGMSAFPDKSALDAISRTVPICLSRVDGHAFWVNSVVLALAGITSESSDPPGGKIVRMENSREPSGVLIDKAMDLIWAIIPEADNTQHKNLILSAIKHLNCFGITSAGDAGTAFQTFSIYKELLDKDALNLRINSMIPWRENLEKYFVSENGYLKSNTIKIYLDGALGSRGAALTDPYTDDPENTGLLLEDSDEIGDFIKKVNSQGYQVAIHAIGDRANNIALNLFEGAIPAQGKLLRNRIEHAQIINQPDLIRFSQLGILPSIQPVHCTSDMSWIEKRLGSNRVKNAYPWASLIKNGSVLLGGSDAPIESADPLMGMFAASTRTAPGSNDSWFPDQKLSLADALRSYTSWAAMGTYEENIKGVISPGYFADFAVLSEPIDSSPKSLLSASVLNTIVNGNIVYEKE